MQLATCMSIYSHSNAIEEAVNNGNTPLLFQVTLLHTCPHDVHEVEYNGPAMYTATCTPKGI